MPSKIIFEEMESSVMRKHIEDILNVMKKEREEILKDLQGQDHPNLKMATEIFEIASLLHPICLKALYTDNELCAQVSSILVAMLNGIGYGNITKEIETLFKMHNKIVKTTGAKHPQKDKSKLN